METEEIVARQHPTAVMGCALVYVESLNDHGEAIARVDQWQALPTRDEWDLVYGPRASETLPPDTCTFVGGLPGERIEVWFRWTTPRPGRRRARRVRDPQVVPRAVIEPSPDRVLPACPVFGECGGCQFQHLAYEQQLDWKSRRVSALLAGAGLSDVVVAPTLGAADPWHYRNHMRFSVDRDGHPGLTARGSHRVLPLRACPIAHPLINRALGVLAETPCPRPQVLVRCGEATGELLLQPAPDAALRVRLASEGLTTVDEALTEELRVPSRHGRDAADRTQTAAFRIRPSSFFQTNTAQANRMAQAVLAGLPAGPHVTLVDAYCGVGTFAALMAPHAGRVLAIEESASAVRDARWNLRDAANVEIVQAKTETWLPAYAGRLDGLVIDPPRAGCARPVLDALLARRVPRVVYVSCDPTTLARDLAYLCHAPNGYRIAQVQPLDMFPQTAHIETIVTLEAA